LLNPVGLHCDAPFLTLRPSPRSVAWRRPGRRFQPGLWEPKVGARETVGRFGCNGEQWGPIQMGPAASTNRPPACRGARSHSDEPVRRHQYEQGFPLFALPLGRYEHRKRLADHLFSLVPKKAFGPRVECGDDTIESEWSDRSTATSQELYDELVASLRRPLWDRRINSSPGLMNTCARCRSPRGEVETSIDLGTDIGIAPYLEIGHALAIWMARASFRALGSGHYPSGSVSAPS
jgi:hypothetical protein